MSESDKKSRVFCYIALHNALRDDNLNTTDDDDIKLPIMLFKKITGYFFR